MAKKVDDYKAKFEEAISGYRKMVKQFDAVMLCNAKLIDGVQKSVKILRDGGVPEQLMAESKLDEYTRRFNYSEVLKDGEA